MADSVAGVPGAEEEMERISSPVLAGQQAQSDSVRLNNAPVKTLDAAYYNLEPAAAPVPLPKELPSNSTPSTPRSETPPPRLKPRVHKVPVKGILKPPTQASTKFNFRRDILQPFNSRLISTAYGTGVAEGPTATIGGGSGSTATGTMANAAQSGGGSGFWGNAIKRLSVATIAASDVAAGVSARVIADVAGLEKPPTPTSSIPSPSTAAPNTPSRGIATSSVASTSSVATIRSTASSYLPPAPPAPPTLSVGELKKVSFRMSSLRVIYPINGGPNGPTAPWEEGKTKKRVNNEYRAARLRSSQGGDSRGWTGEALLRLYGECCRTREEMGIERVKRALRDNPSTPPKSLDLSNELLSHGAIEALSDLLSVDFGLKKLTLESCGIDDESLKPLLHALLVSGNVPTLSLANNKRIKSKGWKLIAIFVRKARFLRYLDLSENSMDKRATDYLVQAITASASSHSVDSPNLSSPPTDSPTSKESAEESSSSQQILAPSTTTSGDAAGLGIVDESASESDSVAPSEEPYLDESDSEEDEGGEPLFAGADLLQDGVGNEAGSMISVRLENCGLRGQALESLAHGVRASTLKHISIRRNRITATGAVALAIMIRDYPLATDPTLPETNLSPSTSIQSQLNGHFEPGNSVTAREALLAPYVRKPIRVLSDLPAASTNGDSLEDERKGKEKDDSVEFERGITAAAQAERESWKNSEARTKLKKQISELPRTGNLLTLDVKDNEIRGGILYISQVLKKNRTLKVLNLSENKIDVAGLVSIADALKFNTSLETLDMSRNPCCGPNLDGVTALRSAITINTSLKRIFLNSTDLSSEGAIALAEFLPEANGLIHLDLTDNLEIDIAGVLALAVSVKMNRTLRCLDLNIPANDPDFANLSQQILSCCIRNTEIAQEESLARGIKSVLSKPILKSVVATKLKCLQESEQRHRSSLARSMKKDEIILAAEECRTVLVEMMEADEELRRNGGVVVQGEVVRDLLVQCQLAEAQLAEAVAATRSVDEQDQALLLGNQLSTILDRAKQLYDPTPPPTNSALPDSSTATAAVESSFDTADEPDNEQEIITLDPSSSSEPQSTPESSSPPSQLTIPASDSQSIDINGDDLDSSPLSPRSPIESQSRTLTLEEGEVFRKGSVAIGEREMDDDELGDVSGEDLKKEILETDVDRSPRVSSISAFDEPMSPRVEI